MTIRIWLTSGNMGDMADERDFDLWARYVRENISESTGIEVDEVVQARFSDSGEDSIYGAAEDQRDTLRRWLSIDGWEAFCGGAWQAMAAEASREAT